MEYDPASSRQALWKAGILQWKLWDQQIPIYEAIRALPDSVTEAVVLCARQYGKSTLGTLMAVEDLLRNNGGTVLIVGPTLKQTVDIVKQSLKTICHDAPPGLIRRSKSEQRWYVKDGELIIGGFDEGNATRHRGKTLLNIYLEELLDSHPDDYLEAVKSDLGPALTHSRGGKLFNFTTPPRTPDHPFITEAIPRAKMANAYYCFTIDDNRALSAEQYQACVDRCGGRDSVEFRREYLCEVVRDDKISIAPHFNPARHVKPQVRPDPDIVNYQTTIDFGGVRDKTVALFGYYDFQRNRHIILEERAFNANTDTETIVNGILEMEYPIKNSKRWADCHGQTRVDLHNKLKFDVGVPNKSDWLASVNNTQLMFTLDRIEVDPSCRLLIETLNSGQFNKNKTDFDRTSTLGHCDAFAALMYHIRMASKENPYKPKYLSSQFVMPKPDPMEELSASVTGKRFGSFRS